MYYGFGYQSISFSRVGSSMMSSFLKVVGKTNYSEMASSNADLAVTVLFVFSILFFFILLNMFIAIVMSNYAALRRKTQLKTEANARIAEEHGKYWTQKLWRLIRCIPQNDENAPDAEKGVTVDATIARKGKGEENKKHSLWNIFCTNLNTLCSFKPETHEKIKNRQKEVMESLKREQLQDRISE